MTKTVLQLSFVLLVAVLVAVAAFMFSAAVGGERIASEALVYQASETALRNVATARSSVQTAVVVGSSDAPDNVIDASYSAATGALENLSGTISDSGLESSAFSRLGVEFVGLGFGAIEFSQSDDYLSAQSVVDGPMVSTYELLVDELIGIRDDAAQSVSGVQNDAEAAVRVLSAVLGFGLPLVIAFVVWRFWKGTVRERETNEALEHERQMRKSQENFIANVSHELRTPLTSVHGFLQLLDGGLVSDPSETAELIRLMYGESGELVRMVDDLLVAARLGTGALTYKTETTRIRRELEKVVKVAGTDTHSIVVTVPDVAVRVDRLRLRQVLRNLLSNAQRYGGPNITIDGKVLGDRLEIVVADDGPGVDASIAQLLFDRFVTTNEPALAKGGFGLGLSIAKEIVNGMGGSIFYDRRDDETRFIFTVLLSSDDVEAPDTDTFKLGGYERVGDSFAPADQLLSKAEAPEIGNQTDVAGAVRRTQSSLPQDIMVDRRLNGPRRTP